MPQESFDPSNTFTFPDNIKALAPMKFGLLVFTPSTTYVVRGLDPDSFTVTADFPVDGAGAGQNLASKFKAKTAGVWELTLSRPITELPNGKLTVSVKARQGEERHAKDAFGFTWRTGKGQPFVTEVVINADYDPSRMQDRLFIAPSLPFLRRELEGLVRRFGIPVI